MPAIVARKRKGNVYILLGLGFALSAGMIQLTLSDREFFPAALLTLSVLALAGICGGILHRMGVVDMDRQGEVDEQVTQSLKSAITPEESIQDNENLQNTNERTNESSKETDLQRERKSIVFSGLSFVGAVAVFLVILIAGPGEAFDQPWLQILAGSVLLTLIASAVTASLLSGHQKMARALGLPLLFLALASTGYSYSFLHLLNRVLDSSTEIRQEGIVTGSRSGSRGGVRSTIQLQAYPDRPVNISGRLSTGKKAVVIIKNGAFGWEWIAAVETERPDH